MTSSLKVFVCLFDVIYELGFCIFPKITLWDISGKILLNFVHLSNFSGID